MNRPLVRVALAALLLIPGTGCFSHYSGGPEFQDVKPPQGYGVVHFYRPKKAIGAAQMIEASQPGRLAILPSGGFATFVVPVGPQQLTSSINMWNTMIMTTVPGVSFNSSQAQKTQSVVTINVAEGHTYYVRTEFNGFKEAPSAELVSASDGADEIDGLHMVAGGRGRYPVLPFGTNAPSQ